MPTDARTTLLAADEALEAARLRELAVHQDLLNAEAALPRAPDLLAAAAQVRELLASYGDSKTVTGILQARRDEAARELGRLAELAEPALRAALKESRSAEVKRRAGGLLARFAAEETVPARLQALRAVELLERIGTPGARKVLESLAQGAPAARLTKEARASLKRLSPLSGSPGR